MIEKVILITPHISTILNADLCKKISTDRRLCQMHSSISIEFRCQSINQSTTDSSVTLPRNLFHNPKRGAIIFLSYKPRRLCDEYKIASYFFYLVSIYKFAESFKYCKIVSLGSKLKVENWNSPKSKSQIIQIDYCIHASENLVGRKTAKAITKKCFFLLCVSINFGFFLATDR